MSMDGAVVGRGIVADEVAGGAKVSLSKGEARTGDVGERKREVG